MLVQNTVAAELDLGPAANLIELAYEEARVQDTGGMLCTRVVSVALQT